MVTLTFEDIEKLNDIKYEINALDSQIERLEELLVSEKHKVEVRDMYPDGVSDYLFTLEHDEIYDLLASRKNKRNTLYKLIETNYKIKIGEFEHEEE